MPRPACRPAGWGGGTGRPYSNAIALDFNHDSALTTKRNNFWDPLHYRIPVAHRLVAAIAAALHGTPGRSGAGHPVPPRATSGVKPPGGSKAMRCHRGASPAAGLVRGGSSGMENRTP
ncbi:hypothetical protein RAA17_23810 [Komagataeibacter rhaeticus]|nr:hypothetical protein [Komagataeibacter rhaeticus]